MKAKKRKKKNSSRHLTYITILGTYVTILGTLLGILFTWSQLRIARSEEDRARRTESLSYTLEAVNTHYQYEIQWAGGTVSVPAPAFRIQAVRGSLHSITAISFDGAAFHQMSSLPVRDSWKDCTVDVAMPAQSVIVDGDVVYDYFFLFLEPVEGQCQLDLICSAIDLNTLQVENSIWHPIDLAQLEFLSEGPKKEMLAVYDMLQKKLEDLPLLHEL